MTDSPEKQKFTDRLLKPKKGREENDPFAQGIIPMGQRKAVMSSISFMEQRVGFIAAAYAVLIGGLALFLMPRQSIVTAAKVNGKCPAPYTWNAKTKACEALVNNNLTVLGVMVGVLALALFITVKMRRRTPAAFTALLAGFAFTTTKYFSIVVGAPFLFYGGWLFLRARRIQKWGTVDTKEVARLAGEERLARKEGRPSKNVTAAEYREQRAAKRAGTSTSSNGPEPSKRYTPPAPKRKKPAPPVEEKKPSKWRAKLEGLDQEG